MTALWQAVKPGSDLVSGMYLALLMLGVLWGVGTLVGGVVPKLIGWWERRKGAASLQVLTEARIILLTLTLAWIVLLSVIIGSDALLTDDWSLLPFPILPE